jgi:hypothetical protein
MANGSGQVPVVAIARESWVFFLRNWRMFVPAAGIVAGVSALGPLMLVMSASPDPQAAAVGPSIGLNDILAAVPGMLARLLFAAAVLRKAVRDEFIGSTGLAFGADETRLLGVAAALACIVVPFGALVYFIVMIGVLARLAPDPAALNALMTNPDAFGEALEATLGPVGMVAFSLFLTVAFIGFFYLIVRLAMINSATIGERRMVMFQTWSWSRGNVLRIFGALMLTGIPAYLVSSIFDEIAISVLNVVATPENAIISAIIYGVAASFVGAMASIPSTALGAILYKGLRPPDFVAK